MDRLQQGQALKASIDSSRGLVNYEKANQINVIESMGALFILNRLMMEGLNEDAYQTIDRSRLFKLCDSIGETEMSIHYGNSSFPLQSIREAPMRGYNKGPKAARGPLDSLGELTTIPSSTDVLRRYVIYPEAKILSIRFPERRQYGQPSVQHLDTFR